MIAATDRAATQQSTAPELPGLESDLQSKRELEHEVLEQRAQELRREARKQARQRAFLREERKKAREEKEAIARDTAALKHLRKYDWFPREYLPNPSEKRLRLNVGGQIFEIAHKFVRDDPDSLLAALSADDCPLHAMAANDPEAAKRIAYIDRDWWIFRDGVLPTSRSLVLQLYREATFWRLTTLMRAIEETHLNLTRTKIEVDQDPESANYGLLMESTDTRESKFWLNKPNWWEAQVPAAKAVEKAKPDWWTSQDEWHGHEKAFGPLSTNPEKIIASKSDVKSGTNVYPMIRSTWGYYS